MSDDLDPAAVERLLFEAARADRSLPALTRAQRDAFIRWFPGVLTAARDGEPTAPTVTAQQDAAQVLAAHPRLVHDNESGWYVCQGCKVEVETLRRFADDEFRQHQVDMLAAADLLPTPEHSCWEKFLAENVTGVQTMAEHDAQVAARAWDEGYGAGLNKGLDIAERAGTPVVSKILPPPRNPYRADRIERQEEEEEEEEEEGQ